MKRNIGLGRIGLMAAMLAAASQGAEVFAKNEFMPGMPGITVQGNEDVFGTYRASSRTHKRYLRQHHLGKFRKGRK